MNATSFHTEFDLNAAPKTTVLIAANFVAFINGMAEKGEIRRKVVNNRMYFIAPKTKQVRVKNEEFELKATKVGNSIRIIIPKETIDHI
jgi:hypothetical protein